MEHQDGKMNDVLGEVKKTEITWKSSKNKCNIISPKIVTVECEIIVSIFHYHSENI